MAVDEEAVEGTSSTYSHSKAFTWSFPQRHPQIWPICVELQVEDFDGPTMGSKGSSKVLHCTMFAFMALTCAK
eukprot:12923496-Prorocentrum_lima.AAC.1